MSHIIISHIDSLYHYQPLLVIIISHIMSHNIAIIYLVVRMGLWPPFQPHPTWNSAQAPRGSLSSTARARWEPWLPGRRGGLTRCAGGVTGWNTVKHSKTGGVIGWNTVKHPGITQIRLMNNDYSWNESSNGSFLWKLACCCLMFFLGFYAKLVHHGISWFTGNLWCKDDSQEPDEPDGCKSMMLQW